MSSETDTTTADPAVLDDPERIRAVVAEGREAMAAALAEAEANLEAVNVEAGRMIAAASRRVQDARSQAQTFEGAAAGLDERATYLDHAATLRQQIADAQDVIGALKTEHDDLTEQVDTLDQRLAELGEQRENTAAQLAAATTAGDVDQVLAHRARIAAVDEVVAAIDSQRQAAHARRTAIVDNGGAGELADAVDLWQRLTGELRKVENELDPTRPEAELDRQVAGLRAAVDAYVADYRAGQAPPNTDTVVVRRTRR